MSGKTCAVLIVAAGRGRRFGGDIPKQYRMLAGRSVLSHSLAVFCDHPGVSAVRVVIHPDDRELYDAAAAGFDILAPVHGGETRQDSVRLGLLSLSETNPDTVLIHDGARPFVTGDLITHTLEALETAPGALPCIPVADTIKRADGKTVETTVDRTNLWRAQTPQGFHYAAILAAHNQVIGHELTDDVAVAEHAGLEVAVVMSSENNFKITTNEDLMRAEMMLSSTMETRTGQGFDVHAFCEGDSVTLCGIDIPYDSALHGHSDADVALHALTDALLGSIGAGDIGQLFPPSDDTWKGADSRIFVEKAVELIRAKGGLITSVDLTIICEAPKIGPHRDAMRSRVADILQIAPDRVNVKGTTTEKLGFTGRKEGIAAQAVATVRLPL